jgi:2-methylcitrate dehydratase PrpD
MSDQIEVTRRLADFAAGITYESLPEDVREQPRMFVLDCVSVALGAYEFFRRNDDRLIERYLAQSAPPGPATVIGHGIRTTPTIAAFVNGTLAEFLDFQDSNMDILTHNGAPIIPAVLATAETLASSWRDVATAIVAGYEVHTRLLWALQPGHWYRGFQGLGTFGTCGAATGVAKLFHADTGLAHRALTTAGVIMPVSSSDNVFRAYTMKACIPGQAASSGITAVELARAGFEGVPLEGDPPRRHAPLHTLAGEGGPKLDLVIAGLGEKWHTRRVCYKPYPAGHLIIGPVELILGILADRPLKFEEVDGIDIVTYDHAIFRCGKYSTPDSTFIDAHFSIPFCVAVALMDGALTPRQLWKERIRDPRIHELASRVTLTEDPGMSRAYPGKWPVELTVRLRNGERITRRVDEVKWSPERLPSWEEIAAKFRMNADPVLGERRAAQVIDLLAAIEPDAKLSALLSLLSP